MISFITGKPGDGKSLFAARCIIEDLVRTDAFIVTNVPLVLSFLREYVVKRRPDIDLDARLKVLPDDQVYEFYRHRSGGLVLDPSPDKIAGDDGTKRLPRPAFVEAMKGQFLRVGSDPAYMLPVRYYIDEAHDFFSAREWATNGRGLLYYASKHRHMRDEIFLITQVMENVEKQLRSLVSETHMTRNQLRRRIGPVRMRPVFKVSSFYGVPVASVKPFAVTTFDLDALGIGRCYKTVGALGVHTVPEDKRNKGWLPWWCLPVGGVLLVLGIFAAFVMLPYLGSKAGARIASGALTPISAKALGAASHHPSSAVAAALPADRVASVASPAKPAPLCVRGWIVHNGRVDVTLSDGRTLTEQDAELQSVQRNGVYVNGKKLWLVGAPARTEVVPLPIPEVSSAAVPVVNGNTPSVLDQMRALNPNPQPGERLKNFPDGHPR